VNFTTAGQDRRRDARLKQSCAAQRRHMNRTMPIQRGGASFQETLQTATGLSQA
jgi:hypothetical protein